jgi:hypothetical protein
MSSYVAPGVSTKEIALLIPGSVQGVPRRPAIVGKGSSTILIENEEVVRGNGTTDTIPNADVADVSSIVGIGDIPGVYKYIVTTDFTVSNNTIDWSPSGQEPSAGSVYYVTYYKNKGVSYYEPMTFSGGKLNDVRSIFGNESSNGVINEVTLGAKLAFANNAGEILALQQNGDTTQNQEDCIDKLQMEELDIIVAPGMCSSTLQGYIFSHVKNMSAESMKKERLYFTSHSNLEASVDDLVNLAISFRNDNVVVIAPPAIDVVLTDAICNTDLTYTVSSAYAGCALAGVIANSSFDEAEPLTRKQLAGIDGLGGTKYTEQEMNKLAVNGVLVLENVGGIVRVRHALTTSIANVNEKELQVKIIRNQTRKDLRVLFEPYIGTKYLNTTNAQLASALDGFCKDKIQNNIYAEYKDIKVEQSSLDPRKALASYSFKPIFTTTWIEITYGLYF